jgi:hypothetical protein
MAKGDVKIIRGGLGFEKTFLVAANTLLKVGDLAKRNGDYAVRIATGDPEIGTDQLIGVVIEESTDTASVAGTVKVFVLGADTILRFKASTPANVDTRAKIDALKMESVACDLTGTTITLDEDEGDDPNVHGFVILDGNPDKGTIDALPNNGVLLHGGSVGQTRD